MTLEYIYQRSTEIQNEATSGKSEKIAILTQSLFLDIIQDDENLFVIKHSDEFYTSPISDNDSRLFLRFFSDEELAKDYIQQDPSMSILEVTTIESIQIAKLGFLNGVFGITLNESHCLSAISIKSFISTFYEGVLNEPNSVDEEYLNCITLINAVEKNKSYKLVSIMKNGVPFLYVNNKKESYILVDTDQDIIVDDAQFFPVDLQSLFFMKTPLKVSLPDKSFIINNHNNLMASLKIKNIAKTRKKFNAATDFYDKPPTIEGESSNYKSVKSLCLKFTYADYDQSYFIEPKEVFDIIEIAQPEQPVEKISFFEELKNRLLFFINSYKNRVKWQKKQKEPKVVKEVYEDSENYYGNKKDTAQVNPIFLILILIMIFFMFKAIPTQTKNTEFNNFQDCLESKDYSNAYIIYSESSKEKDVYDELLSDEIETLLSEYASNIITANELSTSLMALTKFNSQISNIDNALLTASKLEESKNGYVLGVAENYTPDKLLYWAAVIPADQKHYQLVKDETSVNSAIWEPEVLDAIESNAYINRDKALEYAKAGSYFYPSNTEIAKWSYILTKNIEEPELISLPIKINSISLREGANNSVTIYIQWENKSEKTIESVIFTFLFLDTNSNIVSYSSNGNSLSYYQGIEKSAGPYQSGYYTESSTWGWENLWKGYGDLIQSVKIAHVEIAYTDGTSQNITQENDLIQLLK